MPDRRRTPVRPLDPPMVPFALGGTVAWAALGGALLVVNAPADWLQICLAGIITGMLLLPLMISHDRRRSRHPHGDRS